MMTLAEVQAWRGRRWPRRSPRSRPGPIRAAGDNEDESEVARSNLPDERFLAMCNAVPWDLTAPDRDPTEDELADADRILPWVRAVSAWNRGRRTVLEELMARGEPPPEVAALLANRRPKGKRGPPPKDSHQSEDELRIMRAEYRHCRDVLRLSSIDAIDVVSCRWDHPPSHLRSFLDSKRGNSRRLAGGL